MEVSLLVPSPEATRRGGRTAALRRAAILRALGHRVRAVRGEPPDAELLVAELPGAPVEALAGFRRRRPEAPVIVAFTPGDGRDVAPDALAAATRIVVPHLRALAALPEPLRERARAIPPSATPPAHRQIPLEGRFEVAVLAGLRDGADPLRPAAAARLLPPGSRIELLHLGDADCGRTARRVHDEEARNPRFRWLGPLRHPMAREVAARSRLLVLPPGADGGCAALAEALAAGVPVLAARGGGAAALLGEAYPGLFVPWDVDALARLLARAEADEAFVAELRAWCARLRPLVDPARERAAWAALLADLGLPAADPGRDAGAARDAGRLSWIDLGAPPDDFAADVRAGLTAREKRLSCRYLYDAEGSRLFDRICGLEEYYPTRAEDEILAAHADELAAALPIGCSVFELGSGSGGKTRRILGALLARQGRVLYAPLDISPAALRACAGDLLPALPGLELRAIVGEYEAGIARLAGLVPGPRLLVWLGSSIGNLDRDEAAAFLGRVRAAMAPGDFLLLGVDRKKDRRVLERAYDDDAGVTARFNRNLLVRIDRELGGHFEPAAFRHRAVWNEEHGRIEMHLVSVRPQAVRIDALDLEVSFAEGETIHTESSHKYSLAEVDALAAAAGLRMVRRFLDAGERFADVLLEPAGPRVT
jgi:L-histidine N-alpha-methyltransferase